MNNFIYVFSETDKQKMIKEGFAYICECNLGKKAYVFKNNPKSLTFSEEDKIGKIFSNTMYF